VNIEILGLESNFRPGHLNDIHRVVGAALPHPPMLKENVKTALQIGERFSLLLIKRGLL
jgi:hypothetical protein